MFFLLFHICFIYYCQFHIFNLNCLFLILLFVLESRVPIQFDIIAWLISKSNVVFSSSVKRFKFRLFYSHFKRLCLMRNMCSCSKTRRFFSIAECNYGRDCPNACGNCNAGSACDRITGTCTNGCEEGWEGTFCLTGQYVSSK